jgi:hypothetical protein
VRVAVPLWFGIAANSAQKRSSFVLQSRCGDVRDWVKKSFATSPCTPPARAYNRRSMPAATKSPASSKSPTTAPQRSRSQRMSALKRANEIRTRRARLKRNLRTGRTNPQGLLLSPPEYILTAKVSEMLLAVPKYGHVKVNKILAQCRISPSKTIGGLSPRQRAELVSYLRK